VNKPSRLNHQLKVEFLKWSSDQNTTVLSLDYLDVLVLKLDGSAKSEKRSRALDAGLSIALVHLELN
jgi:hypothetical protein